MQPIGSNSRGLHVVDAYSMRCFDSPFLPRATAMLPSSKPESFDLDKKLKPLAQGVPSGIIIRSIPKQPWPTDRLSWQSLRWEHPSKYINLGEPDLAATACIALYTVLYHSRHDAHQVTRKEEKPYCLLNASFRADSLPSHRLRSILSLSALRKLPKSTSAHST